MDNSQQTTDFVHIFFFFFFLTLVFSLLTLLIDKIDTKIENICLTNTCFAYYFCIVNEQQPMT